MSKSLIHLNLSKLFNLSLFVCGAAKGILFRNRLLRFKYCRSSFQRVYVKNVCNCQLDACLGEIYRIEEEKAKDQSIRCPTCAQDPVPVSTTEYNWDLLFQGEPRTTTNNGTGKEDSICTVVILAFLKLFARNEMVWNFLCSLNLFREN